MFSQDYKVPLSCSSGEVLASMSSDLFRETAEGRDVTNAYNSSLNDTSLMDT